MLPYRRGSRIVQEPSFMLMKRIVLFFLALFSITCLHAQMFSPVDFAVGVDVRGGVNVSNMVCQSSSDRYRMAAMPGLNIGAGVDFQLLEGLYVKTGLDFISRGGRDDKNTGSRYFPVYLELPLAVSLCVGVGEKLWVFIDLGGYGAAGVAGRIYGSEGAVYDFFGTGSDGFAGRWDAGLVAGFGATVCNRFKFSFRYSYGLLDIANEATKKDKGSFYSNTMSFQFAYVLF